MGKMIVWDVKTTTEFIREYRKHRILWDLLDPDYRNGRKKKKLWRRIAAKFTSSTSEIKNKIKNLRTTYHRYKRCKLGSRAGKEKWLYFDSLRFLSDVDVARKQFFLKENCDVQLVTEKNVLSNLNQSTKNGKENQENSTLETACNLFQPVTDEKHSSNPKRVSTVKHKNRESSRERRHQHQRSSNKRSKHRNEKNQNDEIGSSKKDDLSIFSEHIANEIRKLRSNAQSIVKHQINNILFDAAMGKFDVQDPSFLLGLQSGQQQSVIQSPSVSSLTMLNNFEETRFMAISPLDPNLTLENHHEHDQIGFNEFGLELN